MHTISPKTTEYVRVSVSAVINGSPIVPTSDNVQMAIVQGYPQESDWRTASWETDTSVEPNVYYARLLVGPNQAEPFVLTRGQIYNVYVKVSDVPETVIKETGGLGVI